MISPNSDSSHFDPAQVFLNIGDRVCWTRAEQWKLKHTIGRIIGAVDSYPTEKPTYRVEFAFGVVILREDQIARVVPDRALPRAAEEKASPVHRKKAYHTTDASKSGMLIPAKVLRNSARPAR